MDLRSMSDTEMDREIRTVFGGKLPWDRKGTMCLVHMDRPSEARRRERVERFHPTDVVDPTCPCCRPLLERGAFVVCHGDDAIVVSRRPDGLFEMVARRMSLAN
jgi:hypothetical protein